MNKLLELQACRTFVCPNIALINQKGQELKLKEATIKRAKEIAIEYFKKTYHKPKYSSAENLLPSCIHIAALIEGEQLYQFEVAAAFGIVDSTVSRWTKEIAETLEYKIVKTGRGWANK